MMAVTLDSLKKAVKKTKGHSQALAWLADMERASGDYEAALKLVDEALAASPSDVPAMLVRAKILSGKQDFAGSISEYKKVLAKDPFCLSAHKRMGESYDKLGKVAERNACFRRVHDMDPLDAFWKDEYDVLTEEEQASMVAPPMDDDSSFTMDVDNDSEVAEVAEEDNVFASLAASLPNTDEEDNTSMDALRDSLDSASDGLTEGSSDSEGQEFDDQVLNSSEVSSAISGILGSDDDFDIAGPAEKEEPETSSLFSHFADNEDKETSDEQAKSEESSEELVEEKSNESLFSLDSLDEPQQDEPQQAEAAETNVDDAFSSLLGDDDLPDEKPAEEAAAEEQKDSAEESLSGLFEKSSESEVPPTHMDFSDEESSADNADSDILDLDETPKAEEAEAETNVDDAFSSLLGDDDLPEEKPAEESETVAEKPVEAAEEVETPAESAVEEPVAEEAVTEVQNEPAEEESLGSLFEKSADADFSMDDNADEAPVNEAPAEVPAAETESSEEESLGGLFEKSADADFSLDETPAEQPAEESLAESVPAEEEQPAENAVPSMHMDFSEEEAPSKTDDDFVLNLDEEPAAEETAAAEVAVAETPAVEETPVAEEESAAEEVDGAFDALFGDEDAEEKTEASTEEVAISEVPTAEEKVETPVEAPAAETVPEQVQESDQEEDVAKEMGGAFASMFGDEDDMDLPEEKSEAPAEEPLSQEATGAEIEESSVKEDVKENVEESFDNIFGSDSDDLPEEKTETVETAAPAEVAKTEEPVAAPAASEAPAEVAEAPAESFENAPSAELDSIDSEVSNAFKGLFDEDDSLTEADEPNNKGVDYLMSGDSDDEVSASLVNDAEAPLSRGAADLDDSLNTRTLADIYMEQGVYTKALEIYSDLAKKNPNNAEIKSRLEEVEKLCREKFGEG
ncbi:tetratricopeptide repeat protein [Fibrobacter sp. UWB11]|uniref:tetratricopeptide repeat protein n=1 Tax=Fibrobacter sp. UWB11 TaxID=1896202 RepID=UPI0009416155|nr:tetratricopeptide repeat protein [Fibrobacter sp. UWB11]